MGVLFEKPQEGYKANLISTIVDGWMARLREEGYKANLISTIVDLQLQLIMFLAIKPI